MYAVQSERARAPHQGRESGVLQFRPARAEDAEACAPLMFASGVREFGFFLGALSFWNSPSRRNTAASPSGGTASP
jgi:hypothetical protein